jgi:toxin ParE1/3/4
MSARRPVVELTPEAEDDYKSILLYTDQTWGEDQVAIYWARILQTLESLRDHPLLGHQRDDLFPGCHSVRVAQHVIYYRQPPPHRIEVVRILHVRQAPTGNVAEPTS